MHAIHAAARYTPHWFRPPYGAVNDQIITIAGSLGLRTALWSVDPQDWALPGTPAIVDRVTTAAFPGRGDSDDHQGGGDRSETVAALPTIIDTLRARGYRFRELSMPSAWPPVYECPPHPGRIFAARNVPAQPDHSIYKTWLKLVCQGIKPGSRPRAPSIRLVPALRRRTSPSPPTRSSGLDPRAERLSPSGGDWAGAAFSKRGTQPRWANL